MSHAQDAESVRRSAAAGVASVEHAWLADRPALEALAESGAFLVPTMVVVDVNRTLGGMTPAQRERQDMLERRQRTSTEIAIELGIPVATGTDTGEVGVTADMVWREIVLLHDHGASPMAAIKAATSAAARLLGLDADLGTIEVGKLADLVLVDGDPTADLRRLATPALVIQGGEIVARDGFESSMTTYLVLLRGINVGGKNKVPMARLRELLEELGYSDVSTYIASGNVILSSDSSAGDIKQQIEEALPKAFRLDSELVAVLVLDRAQLQAVVRRQASWLWRSARDVSQ